MWVHATVCAIILKIILFCSRIGGIVSLHYNTFQQFQTWTVEILFDTLREGWLQKGHQQLILISYVRIRRNKHCDLDGYLILSKASRWWLPLKEWDPWKFMEWCNSYNLEDKVGLDGVGIDTSKDKRCNE